MILIMIIVFGSISKVNKVAYETEQKRKEDEINIVNGKDFRTEIIGNFDGTDWITMTEEQKAKFMKFYRDVAVYKGVPITHNNIYLESALDAFFGTKETNVVSIVEALVLIDSDLEDELKKSMNNLPPTNSKDNLNKEQQAANKNPLYNKPNESTDGNDWLNMTITQKEGFLDSYRNICEKEGKSLEHDNQYYLRILDTIFTNSESNRSNKVIDMIF